MPAAFSAAPRAVSPSHIQGRDLSASAWENDEGAADPALTTALAAFHRQQGQGQQGQEEQGQEEQDPGQEHSAWAVLRALAVSRLLVPVVAVIEELEFTADGSPVDKQSAMAAVMVQHRSGERSMLAFTCLASLTAWRADARPVPVTGIAAAQAALADGATALAIDVAGPITFVVPLRELHALAGARRAEQRMADDPDVQAVAAELVAAEPGLHNVQLGIGGHGEPQITLVVDPTLHDLEYRALVDRVSSRLSEHAALRGRFPEGLTLTVTGPSRHDPASDA